MAEGVAFYPSKVRVTDFHFFHSWQGRMRNRVPFRVHR